MVGYGEDIGIIPKACDEIFRKISEQTTENKTFAVEASMMEIYNEQVRDLFNPSSFKPGGLKVREHPKTGVFVDGLVSLPVHSYKEISDLMDQGSNARTVASTNMNATSSRAHTIFVIILKQLEIERTEEKEEKREKTSKISLIDLAGSERAGDTGATGDRLKEGCAINQSLTALGNVISALVKVSNAKSAKKKKEVFIPYRGSTLTWLMKDSLGGNSKTIMIAAISPASICYDESISTLKYADRAKQIKNKAVVNEDKNVKMIRELKKEVALLRKLLADSGLDPDTPLAAAASEGGNVQNDEKMKELEELRAKLAESQSIISTLSKSDQEKEAEKQMISNANQEKLAEFGAGVRLEDMLQKDDPILTNLHPDEMMNNRIIFRIKEGENVIGKSSKDYKPTIPLGGVGIATKHVILQREENKVKIIPQPNPNGQKTFINGLDLAKEMDLNHMDRIIIGSHTFIYINPVERRKKSEEEIASENETDYFFAQQEFADKQGMSKVVQGGATDVEFEKKMKEMQEKMEREAKAQQEALKREKEEIERQKSEMMKNIEKMKDEQGNKMNEEFQKQLLAKQREAELQFEQQQKELAEKRKKLEEELKLQEELANQLKLKKKREEEQRILLEQNLLQLIPLVLEANSMSTELRKGVRFQTKLIAYLKDDGKGKQETHTDLGIQVINMKTGKKAMWNFDKFQNRYYLMQELYQNYLFSLENDTEFTVDPEKDPFYDSENNDASMVGISMLYLKALSHKIDMQIFTPIINNKGEKQGELECAVIPCTADGKEVTTDFVSDPYSLEGKELYFKVKIKGARGLPLDWCKDSYVQYRVSFLEEKPCKTRIEEKRSTLPVFNYEKIYHIGNISKEFIDYLRNSAVKFEIMAKENVEISEVHRPGSSTRPNTAQQFEMQQNAQLLDQLQSLAMGSKGPTPQDPRRIQRPGAPGPMGNRMGNTAPISQTKTVVNIDEEGRLEINHPPQSDASQTCVIS